MPRGTVDPIPNGLSPLTKGQCFARVTPSPALNALPAEHEGHPLIYFFDVVVSLVKTYSSKDSSVPGIYTIAKIDNLEICKKLSEHEDIHSSISSMSWSVW